MKILIINGPNLNLLGKREPSIYGHQTFEEYLVQVRNQFSTAHIDYFQNNVEGELINRLHLADDEGYSSYRCPYFKYLQQRKRATYRTSGSICRRGNLWTRVERIFLGYTILSKSLNFFLPFIKYCHTIDLLYKETDALPSVFTHRLLPNTV